jgi:8-oxo-dGTP pyrophosphatase MutT (NUDIX family)
MSKASITSISMLSDLIAGLENELQNPLPGKAGQVKMAPKPVNNTRFNFKHIENAKLGGVMILLYPENGSVYFPLMERNKYPGVHSGQISLPGGKKENEDSDLMETAKRETNEEIGVPQDRMTVLGNLSELYIEASNFRVLPSIGYVDSKPTFVEDSREVVNLFQVDIQELINPNIRFTKQIKVAKGLELDIPYFDLQGQMVWGATAMILSEFMTILNRIKI